MTHLSGLLEATGAIRPLLILASASPRRRDLLAQMGVVPDHIIASDIDETPHKGELPHLYARRMAGEKASHIAPQSGLILSADTVVAVGRRILPKAETHSDVRNCLRLLSGRGHRVYTSVCLLHLNGCLSQKLVETRLRFKVLSDAEINAYVDTEEGLGKAGGYGIQGRAGAFVTQMVGSYSAVVGLPLFETKALLNGAGYAC